MCHAELLLVLGPVVVLHLKGNIYQLHGEARECLPHLLVGHCGVCVKKFGTYLVLEYLAELLVQRLLVLLQIQETVVFVSCCINLLLCYFHLLEAPLCRCHAALGGRLEVGDNFACC